MKGKLRTQGIFRGMFEIFECYYELYSYPNIWLMKISNDRFKGSNISFNCQALLYTNALEKARKKEDS